MTAERLAEFSRARLGGRNVPDDLRVMLAAQWAGDTSFLEMVGVEFIEADEQHPLLDTSYLRPEELADPEIQSMNAAMATISEHARLVARSDDVWLGYWTHPDEPADREPSIVEVDTEYSFRLHPGRSLAEALVVAASEYSDDEEAHAELAAAMATAGITGVATDPSEVPEPGSIVDPEDEVRALVIAERATRGLPDLP